jgi:ketosteroid isomerase-like protein
MPSPTTQEHPQYPRVIQQYLAAHDARDVERALSAFSPDATVTDEDREYRGAEQIREWLDTTAHEFTYTRTLVSVENASANEWLITNRLEGDFPGGVVELRYRFVLRDESIAELLIAS